MTNQEILFRLFICEYMGWTLVDDECALSIFDLDHYSASKIIDLFPRYNEAESFEGYVNGEIFKQQRTQLLESESTFNCRTKVKITILED